MSYVEVETGRYVKRWAFWNPATWSIPKLYWDAWSQEQRLHAICRQLEKVIKYADYLGVNVDDIAARLKAIEDGQLDPIIEAAIAQWFEDNEPAIMTALQALNDSLPIEDFQETTVKEYIDENVSLVFDTVSDMVAFEEDTTQKKCMTLGYFAKNDGGSASYIVEERTGGFVPDNVKLFANTKYQFTLIEDGTVAKMERYGCVGTFDQNRLDAATATNSVIEFGNIETADTIDLSKVNGKKFVFNNISYTGNTYAVKFSGTGNIFEFNTIDSTAAGIKVDVTEKQANTCIVTGRLIVATNNALVIETETFGCIWSKFNIERIYSANGRCIFIHCQEGVNGSPSFVGQCEFNTLQMKAPNDFAVLMKCENQQATVTGVHFTPTAIEGSKGGFRFETGSGTYSEIKNVKIQKCRTYEHETFDTFAEFIGMCFDNEIELDSPVLFSLIKYADCTVPYLEKANIIRGGIWTPSSYKFANEICIYNGKYVIKDMDYGFYLASSIDRTFFDTTAEYNVNNWRAATTFYNEYGHLVTFNNVCWLTSGQSVFVNQNYSNNSTIKLIDQFGRTIFDGSNISAEGRKKYKITAYENDYKVIEEVNLI